METSGGEFVRLGQTYMAQPVTLLHQNRVSETPPGKQRAPDASANERAKVTPFGRHEAENADCRRQWKATHILERDELFKLTTFH